MTDNCMGLVLAGGLSTRMGTAKALCKPWGQAGPTMLDSAFAKVSSVCPRSFVSCRAGSPFRQFPCLEDRFDTAGPCRGILTGLTAAAEYGFAAILALACDLPSITREYLLRLKRSHFAATPQPDTTDPASDIPRRHLATMYQSGQTQKVEMLAAIYGIDLIPVLTAGMAAGEASLFRLIPPDTRKLIPYGPAEAHFFRNCNTPADLAAIIASQP